MTNSWKMQGGIANEESNGKTADELARVNLQNNDKKGFQGNCIKCGKPGHSEAACRSKQGNGNKINPPGDGNKKKNVLTAIRKVILSQSAT